MRIAICDDERMYSTVLKRIVDQWSMTQEQVVTIHVYESAEAFLTDFDKGVTFDLSYLDIHLGGMSGVELAKLIRKRDMNMFIVFVTNFFDYVIEGYEVLAFRFLLKPIREKKVLEILNAASEACDSRNVSYLTIRQDEFIYKVAKSDIVYFESARHYITVRTLDNEYKLRGRLPQLTDEFAKPMFTKCNRGILLNVAHIYCIHKDQVIMTTKEKFSLSRMYWEDLNQCFLAVHVDPLVGKIGRYSRKKEAE